MRKIILFGLLSLAFLAAAVAVISGVVLQKQTLFWPSTEGRITYAKWVSCGSECVEYKIKYEYTVDGTRYSADRINFDADKYGSDLERQFSLDARVPVYYYPSNPALACLIKGNISFRNSIGLMALFIGMLTTLAFTFAPNKAVQPRPTRGPG